MLSWGHYGLERGRTSLGSLGRHPQARPGPQQGQSFLLGRAKCSQGGVAKTARAPGQSLPWVWVAGVGEVLTVPCQGLWEPEMAPEAELVWKQHLVLVGPTQSLVVKTMGLEARWPAFKSSLCYLLAL